MFSVAAPSFQALTAPAASFFSGNVLVAVLAIASVLLTVFLVFLGCSLVLSILGVSLGDRAQDKARQKLLGRVHDQEFMRVERSRIRRLHAGNDWALGAARRKSHREARDFLMGGRNEP